MSLLLSGFGFTGFRSFHPEIQRLYPLAKVSFLAGPNNCGKSNVIKFLVEHYSKLLAAIANKNRYSFSILDQPLGDVHKRVFISIPIPRSDEELAELIPRSNPPVRCDVKVIVGQLRSFADAWLRVPGYENPWLDLGGPERFPQLAQVRTTYATNTRAHMQLRDFWTSVTGGSGGNFSAHWLPWFFEWLLMLVGRSIDVKLIPAFRQITSEGSDANKSDLTGKGLIDQLAKLQNPSIENQRDKERFEEITNFVRTVTKCSDANIEVPHERNTIHVTLHGKTLPFEYLGTGIHQVILFAAVGTIASGKVLCLEEPETHLHPFFQRELIRYFVNSTDNQYLIATHSAHMLDIPGTSVFRISIEEGMSKIELARTPNDRFRICQELGYRASDLVQSNAVIWVEGPSDRIYILHWLKEVAPELSEGLHFSIMFYGGRLLNHLSADDAEITDFISLRRLNRHVIIIMDSDRSNSNSALNATKERIRSEIAQSGGIAWVTAGREIENYVPRDVMAVAIQQVHRSGQIAKRKSRYAKVFSSVANPNKIAIAAAVVAHQGSTDLASLDLRERVEELARAIHDANRDMDFP